MFGAAWVITTDNSENLYNFCWEYAETAYYVGSYDNHPYLAFKARNSGDAKVYSATLSDSWQLSTSAPYVVIMGGSYIESHINLVSADADPHINGNYYNCTYVYAGSCLVGYNNAPSYIVDFFPISDTINDPSNPEAGNGGYNDSSFKGLVTELFDHLFDILLYGEDEDYDGTDVDDSIEWLDDLSEDMEDITDKLNQAPTYISNGFTAINNAQSGINDFFSGISTAVPVLYYGIVGILNILIIRKIIGR